MHNSNTSHKMPRIVILGAGVSGLGVALASAFPVFEAADYPGGLSNSYYMQSPRGGASYHFEYGGGHWIYGLTKGEPLFELISGLVHLEQCNRNCAVLLSDQGGAPRIVPYPIQNHLSSLDPVCARAAWNEIQAGAHLSTGSMDNWIRGRFGETLYRLFFGPYVKAVTAGMADLIAFEDFYKTPFNIADIERGFTSRAGAANGYNARFWYPSGGLNVLVESLASKCDIHLRKRAVHVHTDKRIIQFADGSIVNYDCLVSTVPLDALAAMCELPIANAPPRIDTLVTNIGAIRGTGCPEEHWLYVPVTVSGFHRVGFYSNVFPDFVRSSDDAPRVAVYVERSLRGGQRFDADDVRAYEAAIVQELREWRFIDDVEVIDTRRISPSYTAVIPGSTWREEVLRALTSRNIVAVGRYGRWHNRGMAESLRDGIYAGAALSEPSGGSPFWMDGQIDRDRTPGDETLANNITEICERLYS